MTARPSPTVSGGTPDVRIRIIVLTLLIASAAHADNWPAWRGPRLDGVPTEKGSFPLTWSDKENIVWKSAIPGKGHSSPVVWGDRIFLTTALEQEQKRVLLCLDRRNGKTLWERVVVTSPLEKKHDLNSYASATPVTDGQRVWVAFFGQPKRDLAC